MAVEGKINVQSDIVPNNENPRMPVTDTRYVKGSPQVFATVEELVGYHPNLMRQGVPMTVMNYPAAGTISEFKLNTDPALLVDASNNSIITLNNFRDFFDLSSQTQTSKSRVQQYAPDGPGGGAPIYPYEISEEVNWVNEYDRGIHKWIRFRDDDVDANADGIYDNWTVPIPANSSFASGDFLANRYRRQAVSAVVHSGIGTLTADKYYIVQTGSIDITGDLSLNEVGIYLTTSQTLNLGIGRVFKYATANAYTFNAATVVETVAAPPRVVDGVPNSNPVGWTDDVPIGSDQLWEITGQMSVYSKLKSDWIVKKVNENPDFIRYNEISTPDPNTIAGTSTPAVGGSAGDTNLIAQGWVSVYNQHEYMATREDAGGGLYTAWTVKKINNEAGEFKDSVFKLFDDNLDLDDPILVPPTTSNPTEEGFADTPQPESGTKINYVSSCIRYFDRTLKTPWSPLVPYTGKSIYDDVIVSDLGDNFKYDQLDAVTPSQITLRANLYRGATELWQNMTITYDWKIVFNGGSVVDVAPTSSSGDDFYLLAAAGTPGDSAYVRENQRVVIKPGAVDGAAVVRCTQTLAMDQGDDLVFVEEFSILDITDGKDAKSLALTADVDRVIYDTVNAVFNPLNTVLRVYTANIVSPTFYWYRWDGAAWAALANGVDGYTITGNTLSVASSGIFTASDSSQEQRYAVSTHATNPESADYLTTFSDFQTIVKLGSAGVGSAGADSLAAILDNESHTVVLDVVSEVPIADEIGATGRALTLLQVYEGITKLDYGGGADYTIGVASDNADITFGFAANGTNVDIYVATWGAGERSAVCTITITYGAIIFQKRFTVTSTMDAPGAVLLDVDSDKGLVFTPADKSNKTLTAKLYDTSLSGSGEITLPDAQYTFRFKVAGVWSSLSTTNTRVIARADILVTSSITVEAYKDGVLYRSRTIIMTDVNDGKIYRAWTDNATKPTTSQDLGAEDPTNAGIWPVTVSGVVWRLPTDAHWATNSPAYAQDAEFVSGSPSWSPVYQLKGESGSQGNEGGFTHFMYKAHDSLSAPAFGASGNTSTLAEMKAAGWSSLRPASGVIWQTNRYWTGQGVVFDASGDPSTAPRTGSVWQPAVRLTGTTGATGSTGTNGLNGWSPSNAVVSRGATDKVLQLLSWIGGTGSTPSGTGQYLGASGLVSDINLAANIAGVPIELQYNSSTKYIQWKYTTEGSSSWRNLYKDEFTSGFIKSASVNVGSTIALSDSLSSLVRVDTGDTTSKKLSIIGYMDSESDSRFTMRLEGNNSITSSFGALFVQRNYMSYSIGSHVSQYQIMHNITTSYRYIVLRIGHPSGYGGGRAGDYGLTVMKTE